MPDLLSPADAARLYERYGFFLLRRCRTILRDGAAAEDALQQAFERILRGGGAVLHADEPLRWLYRVVDRCCFDVLRGRRRSIESAHGDEVGETAHPGVDIEARDAALKLLATMSEDEMRIAVLLFVDGMSQGEIADEVGLSRVTVNKKIQALRARAGQYLERAS
ncbi:MAG TPA: sigma-70 family RNA polymerase sigma factor [Polyangiaceae bacterium]